MIHRTTHLPPRRATTAVTALLLVATGLLVAGPASAADDDGVLSWGDEVSPGHSLATADGRYTLNVEGGGNLVLHGPYGWLWQTDTAGSGADRLDLQTTGNLVLYRDEIGIDSVTHVPVWNSQTHGHDADEGGTLELDADTAELRYVDSLGEVVWSSDTTYPLGSAGMRDGGSISIGLRRPQALTAGTEMGANYVLQSPNGKYELRLEPDGNLILKLRTQEDGTLVDPAPQPDISCPGYDDVPDGWIWQTDTAFIDDEGSRLVAQPDGNLSILDSGNAEVWSSESANNGGSIADGGNLTLEDDGNLVYTSSTGEVIWDANSAVRHYDNDSFRFDRSFFAIYPTTDLLFCPAARPTPPPPAQKIGNWPYGEGVCGPNGDPYACGQISGY